MPHTLDPNELQLHFHGEEHSIDANTLVNALIHYNALISIINEEYGSGAKAISIKVNAPEKGSFLLDINLVEKAKSLFSAKNLGYISSVITIFGAVMKIFKELKGRPAKKEDLPPSINITIGKVDISDSILNIYNNKVTRESISKTFETLEKDESVTGLDVVTPRETISTDRSEFRELVYTDFDSEVPESMERVSEIDATLVIVALNFERGSTWTFIHRGERFRMQVKDDALMEQIDKGQQFGKGDAIKVKMQITKRYNPEYRVYEISSRRIVKFYELIKRDYKDPELIDDQGV